MKTIVLAGGEARHLDPLTEHMPAPMVPVGNRPVMAFVFDLLARYEYKDLIVPLCRMGGEIESHFGKGERWGVDLAYSRQDFSWGSAGAVKTAMPDSDDTVLVMPADAMIDVELADAHERHRLSGHHITLITSSIRVVDDEVIQPLTIDEDGRVTEVGEGKQTRSFTGAFFIEPTILAEIPEERLYGAYEDLLPALLAKNIPIHTYHYAGYWNPMLTLAHVQEAQSVLLHSTYDDPDYDGHKVRFPYIKGRQIAPGIYVSRNHVIHPSVKLSPPVNIGENCRIGREVELGPHAFIGHNCIINDEATVRDSTILSNTYVGQLVKVERKIVNKNRFIDTQTKTSIDVSDPFLLTEASPPQLRQTMPQFLGRVLALLLLISLSPIFLGVTGLLLVTTNKQPWQQVAYIGRQLEHHTSDRSLAPKRMFLTRWQTRKPNGDHSKFGMWLEGWEGHRLPELWSVAQGRVRLVGVKPLSPKDAGIIQENWSQRRYEYPAGITGKWYTDLPVGSDLGETLVADVHYIRTRRFLEDCAIVWHTPKAWWQRMRHDHSKVAEWSGNPSNSGKANIV